MLSLDRQTEGSSIMTNRSAPKNIDEYIAAFAPEVRSILNKIRLTIRQAARMLGVVPGTIHRWLNDGFIAGEQLTPGAP